ncbi:MAG: hypothetical protein AAF990_26690 [Bacteroidota bacterium]
MKSNILTALAVAVLLLTAISCEDQQTPKAAATEVETPKKNILKETIEEYDLRNDSVIFRSATIENFDQDGHSVDIYWIGPKRDTTLRFYRKYDANKKLVGAEYFEKGDVEPTLDTVYTNAEGLKVEVSMNSKREIVWKSTIATDGEGNEVARVYENRKGAYRGLDSTFFDDKNRMVKGFYKNAKGQKKKIKTYEYTKEDQYQNWTERKMFVNDTLQQRHIRILQYAI